MTPSDLTRGQRALRMLLDGIEVAELLRRFPGLDAEETEQARRRLCEQRDILARRLAGGRPST